MVAVARIRYRQQPETRTRLRIITQPDPTPRQHCTDCANIENCWQPGIEERVIIINLLVCRMKRGINVNANTKLFLELIRPKLFKLARAAVIGTAHELDIALRDFESQTVQYILEHYEVGEIAYPLHYLFGYPNGVLRRFAHAYRERIQRMQRENLSFPALNGDMDLEDLNHSTSGGRIRGLPPSAVVTPELDVEIDDQKVRARMDEARRILEDGLSLPVEEYRILRFCLNNAKDGGFKRPLNGLHVYLARTMDIPRARVTKLFADASHRLVETTQKKGVL